MNLGSFFVWLGVAATARQERSVFYISCRLSADWEVALSEIVCHDGVILDKAAFTNKVTGDIVKLCEKDYWGNRGMFVDINNVETCVEIDYNNIPFGEVL